MQLKGNNVYCGLLLRHDVFNHYAEKIYSWYYFVVMAAFLWFICMFCEFFWHFLLEPFLLFKF
ncbi:hypothetical protein Hanom_Chr03g00258291 [Helianthus anomalus]